MEKSPVLFWTSSLVFRCSSCLFVETNRIRSVSRESVRFEVWHDRSKNGVKWLGQPGMTMATRSRAEMETTLIMNIYLESSFMIWRCPVFVAMEAFRFRKWSRMFHSFPFMESWKPNELIVPFRVHQQTCGSTVLCCVTVSPSLRQDS